MPVNFRIPASRLDKTHVTVKSHVKGMLVTLFQNHWMHKNLHPGMKPSSVREYPLHSLVLNCELMNFSIVPADEFLTIPLSYSIR